jgi:hypothetical protein
MVQQRPQRIINFSFLLLVTTSAFSARTVLQPSVRPSSIICGSRPSTPYASPSALEAGAVWINDDDNEPERSNIFLMNRAIACANSETCSLEEAQSYLNDMMLQIQTMNENVDAATEVVANLRQKIEAEGNEMTLFRTTTNTMNVVAAMYVVYAILHDFSAVPNVPVEAPMISAFDVYTLF